ncbi:MAG TPA: cytochrome c oxidase subunit I [Bacillales bacterium]|nr:cytochrome c oxidase subunit I [Bacillales bacterium]
MSWITTVDHKKIGILYLVSAAFFFMIGGVEAILIRLQLMVPENTFLSGEVYNQVVTMHGTTMIFLAAMPAIFGLMNAIVPLQIGARDVAFPFMNAVSFWFFLFGGLLLNLSWFLGGAPAAGWTAYAPLSDNYPGLGMDFYVLGLQIAGAGTLMGGINFLVTIVNMRAPGMTWMRLPMFTWTIFITSILILFAFPALTIGLFQLFFDRLFGAHFYDATQGGNPVIWEHIFWIFGHPEVYILILPAFGILSDVISHYSRKRIFGYTSMVLATILIGFLAFMVWAHHMFTVGLGPVANSVFSIMTMAIAIPTGVKIFNWLFTLWGGRIRFTTANMFALGFIPTFVMGGTTGVMLAIVDADYQFQDSYFVVAHFHYVIVGGLIFGLFSGMYHWWPKIWGNYLSEKLGKWNFWFFFIGFHLTFFPQHFLGLMGMPRRNFTYPASTGWEDLNFLSTIGALLMGLGTVIFVWNIVQSSIKRKEAPGDAWFGDGRNLEWAIPSPAPEYNFAQTPLVKGLDTFWVEKMEGKEKVTPAEPLGEIHMPNNSIIPIIMGFGAFIAGFGFIYSADNKSALFVAAAGLAIMFGSMLVHSLYDDHGHHVIPDELKEKNKAKQRKGARA